MGRVFAMKSTWLPVVFLCVLAGVPIAVSASDGQPFWLEAASRGPATLEGSPLVDVGGLAAAWRSTLPDSGLDLEGSAHDVRLERHQVTWTFARFPTSGAARLTNDDENVTYETFRDVELRLASHDDEMAIVLLADAAELEPRGAVCRVAGVVDDPVVRDRAGSTTHGSRFNDDEVQRWIVRGRHLALDLDIETARTRGSLHLYWSWATVALRAGGQEHEFRAHAWDESDPSGALVRRQVVWYELRAAASHLSLAIPDRAGALNDVAFAKSLTAPTASALSLDSHEALESSLPSDEIVTGSSLWLQGDFAATLSAAQSPSSSGYSVQANGQALRISAAGADALVVGRKVVAPGLVAVVLAGIAIGFRDVIAAGAARLGLAFYSKMGQGEILGSPSRETLYRAIQASPGISFLELRRVAPSARGGAHMAVGTLAYHLDQLERFRLIVSCRAGRYRRYFDGHGGRANEAARVAILRNRPVAAIARALLATPGSTHESLRSAIAPDAPMARTTFLYHLARLERQGLAHKSREGNRARFHPSPRLRDLAPMIEAPVGAG